MSVRTIEQDGRYTVNFPSGPAKIGPYRYKTQRGGNSKPGLLTENPYTMSLQESYDVELTARLINLATGKVVSTSRGSMVSLGFASPNWADFSWSTNDEYRLLGKLVEKLRDHSFNAAVFGGEARESLNMITDTATKIATAFRYVRRGDIKRAARVLGVPKPGKVPKDAGSAWLALQYGWLPLLGDAYEAGKAVASILNRPRRASVTASFGRMSIDRGNNWANNFREAYISKSVIVRLEEDYSKLASLGLLDPELVAWELLPYSFVADWFLPIGDFLEYRAVLNRTKGTFVATTFKRFQQAGGSGGVPITGGYTYSIDGGSSFRQFTVEVNRTVTSSYNVPLPTFQNPLDLSWKRCVSAISLVVQRFRS